MRYYFLLLLLTSMLHSTAQVNFEFVPARPGDAEIFVGYETTKQLKGEDSIVFYISQQLADRDANEKDPPIKVVYKGSFENNRFNGYGRLALEADTGSFHFYANNAFVYDGMWKNGKMHGTGKLTRYSSRARLKDNLTNGFGKGCEYRRLYEFSGQFIDGTPIVGLYRAGFDAEGNASTFYSGDVCLTGTRQLKFGGKDNRTYATDIRWHGYGAVLRTDRTADDFFGVPGGFYIGQFCKGAVTGFGLYNAPSLERTTPVRLGLLLADRVIKDFAQYNFMGTHLAGKDAEEPVGGKQFTVLPLIDKALYGSYPVSDISTYSGGLYNKLPYGLGLIKYKEGFCDIAFWKDGKKLPVREVLAAMLPDSNVLVPKTENELGRVFKTGKWKNNDYSVYHDFWSKETFYWEREKQKVTYYAAFAGDETPVGWGWKIGEGQDAMPEAGYFKGGFATRRNPNNADTLFIQCLPDWKSAAYWQKAKLPDTYEDNDMAAFKAGKFRTNYVYTVLDRKDEVMVGYFKDRPAESFTEPIAYSDVKVFREKLVRNTRTAAYERAVAMGNVNNLPELKARKLVIRTSMPGQSYVTDNAGNKVFFVPVDAKTIRHNDYLLFYNDLKRVVMNGYSVLLFEDGVGSLPSSGTVHVIRGYRISIDRSVETCPVCNGSGRVTASTGNVNAVIGYDSRISSQDDRQTTITKTPVYTSIPGFTITAKCSACKGVPGKVSVRMEKEVIY